MTTSYNGLSQPAEWPPRTCTPESAQPMRVPYLESPAERIPIQVGRQLFVDDFLIARSTAKRVFHQPAKHTTNPVFSPQTRHELNAEMAPCTVPKCGGIWWDERDSLFKMWYMASYLGYMCLATSRDGLHWDRPELDVVPGTNLILPETLHPDSGTVWLDRTASDPQMRYTAMIREPNPPGVGCFPGLMMNSADGIHWSEPRQTGPMDDRSTMFYNPFRGTWVHSIRGWLEPRRRCRFYHEHSDFYQAGAWEKDQLVYWTGADCMDVAGGSPPELYNLDAVAYESVMIGFYQILKGPPNQVGESLGLPKLTELVFASSRDGYHWHRPNREAFIGADRTVGAWEYGYVESTGGICTIVGDELWFYYSSYGGDQGRITKNWYVNGTYANGAVGLAKLRRDGFASMRAGFPGAELTTRSLVFAGSHLFVNANTVGAPLRVACLEEDNQPIAGFGLDDCEPFVGNSTCAEVRWKDGKSLASLAGKPVRLHFQFDRGDLYAFWVTDSPSGASHGFLAAGGPAYAGTTDD